MISAREGGRIELEDGAALELEAEVLEEDAEVTLIRETCGGVYSAPAFDSCLYRVKVAGGVLGGRFTMTLPRRASGKNASPACTIAQTDDGWRCLADSSDAGNAHVASASREGRFSTRVIDPEIPDNRATDLDFEACGGELEGRWSLVLFGGTAQQASGVSSIGPDPYASCDRFDVLIDSPFTVTGHITFSADGSYEFGAGHQVAKHSLVTLDCLSTIGEACHPDCTVHGDVCECLWPDAEGESGGGGSWRLGETPGTFVRDETTTRYCVDGDQLILEQGSDADRFLTIYERQ
jgi:hypothetical protein